MWRILSNLIVLLLVLRACSSSHASTRRQRHGGDVSTVYRLLDRVLGTNASVNTSYFVLKLCNKEEADAEPTASANATACSCSHQANDAWFCMKQQQQQDDSDEARLVITATSVSELSYGLGYYFRYYCNFTLGWDRIGGSVRNLSVNNDKWPLVDERPIRKRRRVPYSYLMNVCTHSYSLVWYDWKQGWEPFLDWASLMGINNLLACKLLLSCVIVALIYFLNNPPNSPACLTCVRDSQRSPYLLLLSPPYSSNGSRRDSIQGLSSIRTRR